MRKLKHMTLGGIQQKVFNLVLVTLILVMATYSVVITRQMNNISNLVSQTNDRQKSAISDISQSTMNVVVTQSMSATTDMQARIADDLFSETAQAVNAIADYAALLFESARDYPARDVHLPDAALDGVKSAQLLTEAGVDVSDPALAGRLSLLEYVGDMMLSLYDNAGVDSCYIALPEGVMLLVDDHAASKFDLGGQIINIPIHERDWYTGAVETGGLYFTDIVSDLFTGEFCVMCAVPVYVDGELVAVVGADLFLDDMRDYVDASSQSGGFVCIVNHQGHVVFSPRSEGIFQVVDGSVAQDLRTADNADLASLVSEAMHQNTAVTLIQADGESWYMSGAPIDTVGWAVVNVVSEESTMQPMTLMQQQYDAVAAEAVEAYDGAIEHARSVITALLIIVTLAALAAALLLARQIVKPLNTITKRISELSESNLEFKMEDAFRTGDEVQELAESFAAISHRTVEYMATVQRVTAEKERIGAELSLATQIQASMLPHIFPPFPDRTDFDIFASMDPAKEVGGDFFDYFLVDDDHLCMVMADVSGKGVPAALFMMASKIIIQSVAMLGGTPAEILTKTNEAICSSNEAQMFVTVWLGILELSTGRLTAANAGHEYPVIKTPNGDFEIYKDRHGFVIGGMEGIKYRQYELQMEPGAKLFIYTDGVPEATNAQKELFGMERTLAALNQDAGAAPQQILKNVRAAVDDFVQDAEQFDDLTMLCLSYKGPDHKGGDKA